jgi:glycosyltransferase involved in cell wall biosynthesis
MVEMLGTIKPRHIVSIIITSYNYGRFLTRAIDSALGQTYPHTEVIVVDDGSTDYSAEVIAAFKDKIIAVLKENGGQASAFNTGFCMSRGDIICFLDSDDVLLPTAMEEAVHLFADPGVVKVHWPLRVVDENDRTTGAVVPAGDLQEGDLRDVVARGGPGSYAWPPTSGNAWARKFIHDVFPIPEDEYRVCPDLYLSALAPMSGTVKRIRRPQGRWRVHGENSTWRESFIKRVASQVHLWEHCFGVLSKSCQRLGIEGNLEVWRANSWWHRLYQAVHEIITLVPPGGSFILVDGDQWGTDADIAGRRRTHFLERDGHYWGPPPDDSTAIHEFERLRRLGADLIVFAWSAFWWLDHYAGLRHHLRSTYRCVLENDRLVVFDLHVDGRRNAGRASRVERFDSEEL